MISDIFDPTLSSNAPHLVPRERMMDGTIRFLLHARPATLTVGEQPVQALTYNGTLPGPLLSLQEGERVRVVFTNKLDAPTNLHLHGLHLPPGVDAPHEAIPPGGAKTYAFDVPEGAAGTYWYHPHAHGSVTRQLLEGLAGPLIVRGPLDREEPLASAQELVLVLQELSLEGGRGREGRLLLVNGRVQPAFAVRTGVVRLRLINASTARDYHLALPGRPLHVIGLDGSMLEAPVAHESLRLVPGERADVLVEVGDAGLLQLLTLPSARAPRTPAAEPGVLLTLQVEGEPALTRLPTTLRAVE